MTRHQRPFRLSRQITGFTLIELLVAIVVIGVLATIAVPAFQNFTERQRVIGATQRVYDQFQIARGEAIKQAQNVSVYISADGSDTWAIAVSTNSACNAASGASCELVTAGGTLVQRVTSAEFVGVNMTAATSPITFNWQRNTANGGTVSLASSAVTSYQANVVVGPIGRVKICAPSGMKDLGYGACS